MWSKTYIAVAFIVGMLFQYSITGEHARYGFEVMEVINRCERREGKECDIIAAPVSKVPSASKESDNV